MTTRRTTLAFGLGSHWQATMKLVADTHYPAFVQGAEKLDKRTNKPYYRQFEKKKK